MNLDAGTSLRPFRVLDSPVLQGKIESNAKLQSRVQTPARSETLLNKLKRGLIDYEALKHGMELSQHCYKTVKGEKIIHDRSLSNNQAEVYKTCAYVVSDCAKCKDSLAVKIYHQRSYQSPEPLQEARILRQLNEAFAKDILYGSYYSKHIIEYVDYIQESREKSSPNILVTKLVEYSPGRVLNLKEFLRSGQCTVKILDSILMQVFLTLDYAIARVPGFVHFDLLCQQIFLRKTEKMVELPTPLSIFKSKTSIEAVIGDFGFSISDMYPNKQEPIIKDFQLRVSGFDVYRLLTDCYEKVSYDLALKERLETWLFYCFKGQYSAIEDLEERWQAEKRQTLKTFKTWGYLPLTALKYIRGTPWNFLNRLPFLKLYFTKTKTSPILDKTEKKASLKVKNLV